MCVSSVSSSVSEMAIVGSLLLLQRWFSRGLRGGLFFFPGEESESEDTEESVAVLAGCVLGACPAEGGGGGVCGEVMNEFIFRALRSEIPMVDLAGFGGR